MVSTVGWIENLDNKLRHPLKGMSMLSRFPAHAEINLDINMDKRRHVFRVSELVIVVACP